MLQLSKSILNQPVRSLRTGGVIATATVPIIDPTNLKIIGFYCNDHLEKRHPILLEQDIRDVIPQGFVVNDYEVLTEPLDLVKYRDTIDAEFMIIGKQVVTESGQKIGKVEDFATDMETFYIQKLYVSRSLLRSFNSDQLGVDRSRIVEITDKKIVIKNPLEPQKAEAFAAA